jgi:hypothetical protein
MALAMREEAARRADPSAGRCWSASASTPARWWPGSSAAASSATTGGRHRQHRQPHRVPRVPGCIQVIGRTCWRRPAATASSGADRSPSRAWVRWSPTSSSEGTNDRPIARDQRNIRSLGRRTSSTAGKLTTQGPLREDPEVHQSATEAMRCSIEFIQPLLHLSHTSLTARVSSDDIVTELSLFPARPNAAFRFRSNASATGLLSRCSLLRRGTSPSA